jgi:hypothetical protein
MTQKERPRRAYRYSPDCPGGRIFEGADAIAAAEKDGWVDSPGAVEVAGPTPAASKKKASKKKVATKKVAAGDDSK